MAAWRAWGSRRFAGDFSGRLVGLMTWIPVAIYFHTFVAELTFIKGGSMYPFFNEDRNSTTRRDVALNWKLYAHEKLARGMIVTFKSPLDPDKIAVKRIIGMEGDLIWARHPHHLDAIRVPKGHIWVEGDAGSDKESLDSNTYGPISTRLVTGRLTHVVYPFKKFGQIRWWEHKIRTRPEDRGGDSWGHQ